MFAAAADVAVSSASRLKGKDCKKIRAGISNQLNIEDSAAFDELFPVKVRRCVLPCARKPATQCTCLITGRH